MTKKINISDKEHRNLFKLPENYFEELPLVIKHQIQSKPSKPSFSISFKWGAVLTSLAFFMISFWALQHQQPTHTKIASITAEEAYQYLNQNDLLDEDYMIDNLVATNTTIQASNFYLNNSELDPNDLELLNDINYLDLEDYELEY